MGKGDKKSKKGKIASGSFGVSRPHKKTATPEKAAEAKEEKPKKATKK